jgi:hypothetical protein
MSLLLGVALFSGCAHSVSTNTPSGESQPTHTTQQCAPEPEPADDGYQMTSEVEAVMGELLAAYADVDREEVLKIQRHKDLETWLSNFPTDINTVYYFTDGDYYEQKKARNNTRRPGYATFEYFIDGEDAVINLTCETTDVAGETTLYCRYRTFELRAGESRGYESYRKLKLKENGINIVTRQTDALIYSAHDTASWKVHQWLDGKMSEPLEEWSYPAQEWTPEKELSPNNQLT